MIYFIIHTPKTSGTTFVDVLSKDKSNSIGYFYPSRGEVYDFEATVKQRPHDHFMDNPDWQKFNFIAGHYTFGIHDIVKANPAQFKYISTVREPVAHYVSLYKAFSRMSEPYKEYMLSKNNNKSIHALLDLDYTHNFQTFFLSGLSHAEIRKDKQKAYEITIENFEKYYAGIYLTEHFDEGLFYLKHKAGIKPLYYKKKNVATNNLDAEIVKGAIDRIMEVNDVDRKIYEYVTKKFNEEYNAIPGIKWEVMRFKLFNYLYGNK
jgi:hypothetical protein